MDIIIKSQEEAENFKSLELICGKKSAVISISSGKYGYIGVCCQNAAHKVWRGGGKNFDNFDQALAAYKSPEMKAMINFAREN